MKKFFKLFLVAALFWFPLLANAGYTFTELIALGGSNAGNGFSNALGINDLGQVVGRSSTDTSLGVQHATLWSNGSAYDLGTVNFQGYDPNIVESIGNSINNLGQVAGTSQPYANYLPALWSGTTVSTPSMLSGDSGFNSGPYGVANSINDSGQAVGFSANHGIYTATLWANGTATALPSAGGSDQLSAATAINSSGQVVGISQFGGSNGYIHATIWNGTIATDLGGGNYSAANSINASGQIVGRSGTEWSPVFGDATLWANGTVTNLGKIGLAIASDANSINASGQIVGLSYMSDSSTRATLWINGTATDLNSLLKASDIDAGWVLNSANSINSIGQIVGVASNSSLNIYNAAFLLSPVAAVPETNTNLMLLIGIGLFGFIAWKRNV